MRTKRLVGWSEARTLEVLERALRGTRFRAWAKVRLEDVLDPEATDRVSFGDRDHFFMRAHFDFLVCDRRTAQPVFAVEFDGPFHETDKQRRRDIRKNRFCGMAKLPLLRVEASHLEEYDRVTLLEFMVRRFAAWEKEHPRIEARVQQVVDGLEESELARLTEGGVLDPSIDPSFLFDLDHPFPGIDKVRRRLSRRGVGAGFGPLGEETHTIQVALGGHTLRFEGNDSRMGTSVAVIRWNVGTRERRLSQAAADFRWDKQARRMTEYAGPTWRAKGGEVLFQAQSDFSMRWWLPVVEDYDPSQEPPAEYFSRTGAMPVDLSWLDGASPLHVSETFADYLAIRQAEQWVERNLAAREPVR